MSEQLALFPAGALRLFVSNQLENLAERLAHSLATPLASAFTPEIILVQSRGMRRWLSLQLAEKRGVSMHDHFPFPRTFIDQTLRAFFPDLTSDSELAAGPLAWRIHTLLPMLVETPAFAPLRQYLVPEDALKSFQLAERIAQLFDQYLVYRPELLVAWEDDPALVHWQAVLWRALTAGARPLHLARIASQLEERLAEPPIDALPARVAVFGISTLPPFYLRVLFGLARHCEVNLFWLHPSQEYFGHDLTPKQRARHRLAVEEPSGHPLLASLGQSNRDFTNLRLELDERAGFFLQEQPECFVDTSAHTMLALLQRDILHAEPRGTPELPKAAIATSDRSLQIHACHSPLRVVEVLYDHLLERFAADSTLRPRDIFVVTPDIEKYAPFIAAVFAAPEEPGRQIPFSIADRRSRISSPAIEACVALLALPGSRCTATEIHALLARPPIRRRFAFSDDDLAQMKPWMAQAGIRWGVDRAHRTSFALPGLPENTWRMGLDRLLLGYAMSGSHARMFNELLPCDEVEGAGAELLGRFISAVTAMQEIVTGFAASRPLESWADALSRLIEQFLDGADAQDAVDVRTLRTAVENLRQSAASAGAELIEFRVVRHSFTQLLDQSESRGGFLTGGVTFCALQPMRSIPARLICLLGLDDQAFPRQTPKTSFDLMAAQPQPGDRSPRNDDRYIFLETLISAREALYCSYVGRSAIDNEEAPPSVLLSELLDCLDQSFTFPGGQNARAFLVTTHRLQAFSTHYFGESDPRLFSYSEANASAARQLLVAPLGGRAFFDEPLPPPDDSFRQVELRSLVEFFLNPARFFLRHRLGIRLEERHDFLADEEPFSLDALERYQLRQELTTSALAGQPLHFEQLHARQVLPLGDLARATYQTLHTDAEAFAHRVESELKGAQLSAPMLLELEIGNFSLTGKVEWLFSERLVHYRCASLKPRDQIRAWIAHLAFCAAQSEPGPATLIAQDAALRYAPPAQPAQLLAALLELYWRGLSGPLPFFPATSLAYSEAMLDQKKSPPDARKKARAEWFSSDKKTGEAEDESFGFCFQTRDPFSDPFAPLALAIYEPMLQHRSTVS